MGKFIDLTGQTFGRLVAVRRSGTSEHNAAVWECRCECGRVINVTSNNLRTGHSTSCGCARKESTGRWLTQYNTKHGQSGTRLYTVWQGIKARTTNPNNKRYAAYGGRGIKLCDEWNDFNTFSEWAKASGYDEDAPYGECTIDRIDVNGDHEPNNCRWVSLSVQAKNKRRAWDKCRQDTSK